MLFFSPTKTLTKRYTSDIFGLFSRH